MPEQEEEKKTRLFSKAELDGALAGFWAILPPVFFTMVLSAFTVLYLTPDADETFQESAILVLEEGNATSNSEAAQIGIINALVVVGVITIMTFFIVLVLYFNLDCLFGGYLFFALLLLMGFTTGLMVVDGLKSYEIPTDLLTLGIFFYNYAVVGCLCIFSFEFGIQGKERLIPYKITQFYLVIISVVMAWLVTTIFPSFTVWALLVFLGMYDLFAVLTPCGPLNLLLKVITNRKDKQDQADGENGSNAGGGDGQMIPGLLYEVNTGKSRGMRGMARNQGGAQAGPLNFMASVGSADMAKKLSDSEDLPIEEAANIEVEQPARAADASGLSTGSQDNSLVLEGADDTEVPETDSEQERLLQEQKIAERERRIAAMEAEEYAESANLKLGLGDFVFYSVLTAKSAEFGFLAFISVAVCVLWGLCATLVLLSVFQKALPALPISIALGVITYVVAFNFISPLADDLSLQLVSI